MGSIITKLACGLLAVFSMKSQEEASVLSLQGSRTVILSGLALSSPCGRLYEDTQSSVQPAV
ncbi:hypothetical protein Nmel_009259 [Mimus melanotis]